MDGVFCSFVRLFAFLCVFSEGLICQGRDGWGGGRKDELRKDLDFFTIAFQTERIKDFRENQNRNQN